MVIRCGQALDGSKRRGAWSGYDYGHQIFVNKSFKQQVSFNFSFSLFAEQRQPWGLTLSNHASRARVHATGKHQMDFVLATADTG